MKNADAYAKSKQLQLRDYFNQMLNSQNELYNNQINSLNAAKNQAIDSINNRIPTIEQNALNSGREAFVNKMLANKTVNTQLNQAGLNTSGKAGTAQAKVESAYAQNLNNILLNKQNQLNELEQQKANANNEYMKNLMNLRAQQNASNIDLQKYMQTMNQQVYDSAYNKYIDNYKYQNQLAMQKAQQDFELKKYQDLLKQQAWENNFNEKKYELDSITTTADTTNTNTNTDEDDNNKISIKNEMGKKWYKNIMKRHKEGVMDVRGWRAQIQGALLNKYITENEANKILEDVGLL